MVSSCVYSVLEDVVKRPPHVGFADIPWCRRKVKLMSPMRWSVMQPDFYAVSITEQREMHREKSHGWHFSR
jgi:hypothetical protein